MVEHLSSPLKLPNGHVLENRIGKAALSEGLSEPGSSLPGEKYQRLYRRWGSGGAGMLLTGNVIFDPRGRTELENVIVHDECALPSLRAWADAAQAEGSQLWMQINHSGRQALRLVASRPLSPSSVRLKGMGPLFGKARAMSEAEIEAVIEGFARTAGLAKRAGFAGVQIHGAHGYLVSQFLSPLVNLREDVWGGSAEKRRRFLLEILRATRREVGASYPIAVKLNSADFQRGGFEEEESMQVVQMLAEEGIELLEISGGNYENPRMTGLTDREGEMSASTKAREAYFLEYAQKVRALVDIPLMLTGGLRSAAAMESVIAEGHVDMVGLGRPMIIEPDLPRRLLRGESEAAMQVNPHTGIKKADAFLQNFWYREQIHRLGAGLDPDPNMGLWSTILKGVWENMPFHPRAKRWPGTPPADVEAAQGQPGVATSRKSRSTN